jgi:hypothetical protein
LKGDRLRPLRSDQCPPSFPISPILSHHNIRAHAGQFERGGTTNAAAGAGDYRYLSFQLQVTILPHNWLACTGVFDDAKPQRHRLRQCNTVADPGRCDRGTGAGKISGNVFGEPRTRRHAVQDNK